MNTTLQLILSIVSIIALVNADRIYYVTEPVRARLITRINVYLLKKSYRAAMVDAKKFKAKGMKVYLLLWNGDWEAMPKQNFKQMWHSRPGMKKFTIQQWERKMIEV